MRITEVEGFVVKVPREAYLGGSTEASSDATNPGYVRRPPYRSAYSTQTETFLVKIVLEDGTTGWGEAQAPLVPEVAATLVERLLGTFLLGRDVFDSAVLWSDAYDSMRERGHVSGFMLDAIAACDIAVWDLKGKLVDRPLTSLLGGRVRQDVPCYVSGVPGPTAAERAALAVQWQDCGFDRFNLSLGRSVAEDVEVFRTVREAVGPQATLHVDAHWRYSSPDSIALGRGLAPFGPGFLEAPVAPEDRAGQAEVARALDTPVAVGEELRTRYAFRDLLVQRAADVAQPDVGRMGISEIMAVATVAEAFHVPVALHLGVGLGIDIAASLHVSAALPNLLTTEYQPRQLRVANTVLRRALRCEAGSYDLPAGPGLGIEIDEDALRARTTSRFCLAGAG